ncbi:MULTISPECIES: ABC transporter substrate-binding protein [unclassified Mesotoga]|uniref:ABC transporter substrate-binding protein n=1 Tax=unclassified Mesotoga TaxID=1184398 RepID=UPI000DA65B79|nr:MULTISPECIES: ABC transporter substrate-binding protein [unclassified Mesotoga]PZC52859.1 ABC transporter substrate-binding protein [Mesotoga sp. TolDC]
MRKSLAVIVVAILSVALFAVSDVLVIAIETEPVGFDPTLVTAFASHRVLENVYDGLLRYDENMNLIPNLAEDFEVVDPYTIVFEIREGVKFHNGEVLTVEDVLYTFERIMDPDVKAPAATYYGEVKSIKVIEGNKVEFKLKIPMASSLLPNFAGVNSAILSKSFVESGANLQLVTNGTGPFLMAEFVAGNYITLRKNAEYFVEGLPYLSEIKMMIMPEEVTRVSALRNGDVDLAKIGEPLSLNQLSTDRFKIFRTPVLSYYLLGFNTTRGALSKPEVRNALNYAINREMIVKAVAFDEATVTGPLNPELDFWAVQPNEFEEYTYNPAKAKQLLTDAGYPNGFEFEIVAAQRYNFDKVAQVIQAQLAEIGVTAKINIVEWGIFISKWRESDFDSFISSNSGSIDPDIQFNRTFRTGGSTNVFLYSNPEVDELLDRGRSESDIYARQKIYVELQKKLVEDSPILFLYSANTIFASNNAVEGFRSLANESLVFLRETQKK